MRAAAGGYLDIVKMLINVAADLEVQNDVSHCFHFDVKRLVTFEEIFQFHFDIFYLNTSVEVAVMLSSLLLFMIYATLC